jgi:hypothetical protein
MIDKNLHFIRQGKTGCVFATILSRDIIKSNWERITNPIDLSYKEESQIVSFIFEDKTKEEVLDWALNQGMYLDITSKNTTGLRYKGKNGVSWVQYFGPDSHVKTRQAPIAELLFCVKLPKRYYYKVGFKGVLHLAHASIEHLKENTLDVIWDNCFKRTKKILGYKPTIEEAAKTTYKNQIYEKTSV